MASNFYRQKDLPRYFLGHGLELGFVVGGIIATVILLFAYRSINANRRKELETATYTAEEMAVMGDKAPTFTYMY